MRTINKSTLDSIKIRVEKFLNKKDILFYDYENMRENILFLIKENAVLKEKLFDLEQELPDDKRWENILASKLELAFLENEAKEFFEINNSINNQTYTIIIQKKFGKTPKQLLKSSEIRRLKAIRKIVSLQKHIIELQKTCTDYNNQIGALTNIVSKPFQNDESVRLSRQIVEAALLKAQQLAHSFNTQFIKYETVKLHKSFTASYYESWRRASDAESQVEKLKNEISKIKRVILQKKYPFCRIYKGRLKKK